MTNHRHLCGSCIGFVYPSVDSMADKLTILTALGLLLFLQPNSIPNQAWLPLCGTHTCYRQRTSKQRIVEFCPLGGTNCQQL